MAFVLHRFGPTNFQPVIAVYSMHALCAPQLHFIIYNACIYESFPSDTTYYIIIPDTCSAYSCYCGRSWCRSIKVYCFSHYIYIYFNSRYRYKIITPNRPRCGVAVSRRCDYNILLLVIFISAPHYNNADVGYKKPFKIP